MVKGDEIKVKYQITYNSTNSTKKYEVNDDEKLFFGVVFEEIGEGIELNRMSDGTLDVNYCGYPIGKIKLQGRKYKMQILKGLYGIRWIEGNLNDFISHIQDWKKYVKWVMK